MLVSNHITLLQSVKLSETDVVAAGVRTRPLRCFAIRVLSSDSCCLRNVIVDIKCQRSGYHRPGPGCRRKVRWRSSSPLSGSPHKATAGHAFRSAPETRALNPRGCFRQPEGPSKGSLALILPTIVGPPPRTRPRPSMPFDRHPVPGFFAPLTSNANKWCK